jgi:hypothetical protein
MNRAVILLALAGLLCLGGAALAEIGAVDNVPAATLLIPRFEVDLNDASGITTLFSVNNASAETVVAHVTLWTEWWIPVIDFDIYLTGYDVQTVNVRDIFLGDLPNTGPNDVLSNTGFFSGDHNTFSGTCSTTLGQQPNYGPLSPSFRTLIAQAFTGQPVTAFSNTCFSEPGGSNGLARGYITIDSVSRCSQEFPDNDGYFVDGGVGVANNNNVLWGDYFLVDPANNFAQGWSAVHIEADGLSLAVGDGSCDPVDRNPTTFYCTLRADAGGADAVAGEDNREGLPSIYGTRYVNGGAFTGGTDLIVWRDKFTLGPGVAVPCNTTPPRASQNQLIVFDEQENPLVPTTGGPSGEPGAPGENPFPWCTNRASVGTDFTVDSDFGWVYLNLNTTGANFETQYRQAHVTTVMDADGRFSVGYDAFSFNNLTLGADNRRGIRNPNATLGTLPNANAPTIFSEN